MDTCEKCGGEMQVVQPLNPGLARCASCGHELTFLSDAAPPLDPDGDADGLLVIDSFNGREKQAALVVRHVLNLTPTQALAFLRDDTREVFWLWEDGLHHLVDLQQRLADLGVSCQVQRVRGR